MTLASPHLSPWYLKRLDERWPEVAESAPKGTGPSGRRLWRSVTGEYDLAEHESVLLRQAVNVADVCAELQATVDREGLLVGGRAHPGLVELRQQRILLARLIVALRVPMGDQDDAPERTQFRGTRGVYSIKGGAA